jgi:hypothetical protein
VISPALRVFDERFRDGVAAAQRGYRSSGFAPSLHYLDAMERSLRVEFRRERADSLAADGANWNFARDIRQWDLRSSARTAGLSFAADANWREAKLPGSKSETTRLGDLKIGRRSPGSNFGFDLEYRAGTSETRVLGREILFVGFLEGDYDAEGNPVGVRQGDYNVVFTPSDSLVRATDVELQATVDYSADWQIVRGFSSRTLFTVRERSRSDDIGSVLRLAPSVVRDGELTLFGEERIREDLDLLRSNRRLDLRLSIDRRELLDQRFSQGPERSRRLTRNARLESQLAGAASVRVEIGDDARDRERDSTGNPLQVTYRVRDRFVAGTLRYRSSGRGRAAVALRVTRRDEELNGIEQDIAELLPSFTTEFFRGRWTVEARYARIQEKEVGAVTRPLFFELAGTSRSSSVGTQWELGSAFTVGLRYSLRDEAQRALRQDLSLETRARF